MQRRMLIGTGTCAAVLLSACGGTGDVPDDFATTSQEIRPTTDQWDVADPVTSRPTRPLLDPTPTAAPTPVTLPPPTAGDGATVAIADPPFADLIMDGSLDYYESSTPGLFTVRIPVHNSGNTQAPCADGHLFFNESLYPAVIAPHAMLPGATGFIYADVPATLRECTTFQVDIDASGTMQKPGGPDYRSVYANDHAILFGPCLTWNSPLPLYFVNKYGLPAGATLEQIVSSKVQGSALGLCSKCHNTDDPNGIDPYPYHYHPSGHRGAVIAVSPPMWIEGTSWNSHTDKSWALRFIETTAITKPPGLKAAFQTWLDNGAREW